METKYFMLSVSNSPIEIADSTTPKKYKMELEGLGVCLRANALKVF
jgi:hypothetical protein